MKNYIKSAISMLLVLVIILSLTLSAGAAAQPTRYSTSSNSGERGTVCTTLSGTRAASYYTGSYTYDNLSQLSSSALLASLRTLLTNTHTDPTSYSDCKNYADDTDCENESGKLTTLYSSYVSSYNASTINREHVWPKSLGGYETSGPGADMHHIRPTEITPNSNRGSLKYGEVLGGKTSKGNASGYVAGYYDTYFEPLDNAKGDVARICLYMYVRYGGMSQYTCSNINKVFQSVDVLLDWCELDPVDTWEMGRNEVVANIQGNRNVFIDYPEYAWLLFGEEVPAGMQTPSGNAGGSASGGGSSGSGDAACTHSSTELRGAVSATCGKAGYTGDKYCLTCGVKVSSGKTVAATGSHSWGSAVTVTPPTETAYGVAKHTCTVCGATKTVGIPPTGSSGGATPPPNDGEIILPDDGPVGVPERTDEIAELLSGITADEDRIIILLHLGIVESVYNSLISDYAGE